MKPTFPIYWIRIETLNLFWCMFTKTTNKQAEKAKILKPLFKLSHCQNPNHFHKQTQFWNKKGDFDRSSFGVSKRVVLDVICYGETWIARRRDNDASVKWKKRKRRNKTPQMLGTHVLFPCANSPFLYLMMPSAKFFFSFLWKKEDR